MVKKPALTLPEAEVAALRLLGFLADDAARLSRFLALSGLTPEGLRARAADRDLLASILDYVLADEPLLLEAAAVLGMAAAELVRAGDLLAGRSPDASSL